jgi:2-methylisocitrate lyase-like PEP mutase family enzyme
VADLGDTIERLISFAAAGADCVYAPGLTDLEDIATVVLEVGVPLNVLLMPGGPTIDQLADVGVRRVSTGGALAWAAYGAMAAGARELLGQGTSRFTRGALSADDRRAFDG